MDKATKDRLGKNQALFRDVNDRVKQIDVGGDTTATSVATRWEFLCECGRAECTRPMSLSIPEYEELRSNPLYFAVVPGHELPELERVIARTDRYVIVEKLPGEDHVARETDPRA